MKIFLSVFRKIRKNRIATTLGFAGLVVGLMCVVYIFLIVTNEVSFDRFHSKLNRIFVVHAYLEGGNEKVDFNGCPPAVGTALKNEYPEVETTCRFIPAFLQYLIVSGENRFTERTAFADFSFFDIFSFPFIYGYKGEENTPNQIIFTQKAAQKYFGKSNPVGKIVRMDNRVDMTVVGVIRDIPDNSSITFDVLIPLENIGVYYSRSDYLTSWYNNSFTTFGLLTGSEGYEKIASTITRRIQKEIPESTNYLRAYKFKDRYLFEQKHIRNVDILSLVGILILFASILNFINLHTARSSKQAKETGLKKTFGATRMNLVRSIYSEIALVCLLAFGIAIILDFSGLNLINRIIGTGINLKVLFSTVPIIVLCGLYILTVIIAGSYPAFFLSSFTPGQILSSNFQTVKNRSTFRNALIVTMFTVSIILLTSTLIISRQTQYLQKMDLGFEKDQLMYISLKGKMREQAQALKQELSQSPGVISSCIISHLPTMIGNNGEGWSWEGKDPNFKPLVTSWETDEDLLKTFNAKMFEGDFFNRDLQGIIINKSFADLIGWDNFAGKTLYNDTLFRILGVINDIHFNSLSSATKPMVISIIDKSLTNYLVIKINSTDKQGTINFITKTCQAFDPSFPVESAFLNDRYDEMLAPESKLKKSIGIFSVFSIVVLCLGLLGMVMFCIEQKTKEIGIRKCLGEKVSSIIRNITKSFIISGIIAEIIAIPLTWYFMNHWLSNYAYHINLKIWIFVLSGAIIIGLALISVLLQSWKAATKDPVEALRYE
jgi:putative ABC transport system permease protein